MFLNTWYGNHPNFYDYITKESPKINVFCFQEADQNMCTQCSHILTNYTLLYGHKGPNSGGEYPQATYVKNDIKILSWSLISHKHPDTGLGIYCQINYGEYTLNLCNFHGAAYPGDKQDTPARLEQTSDILEFFADIHGPKIIGGDFNLNPHVESVLRFERSGYLNLIKEKKIPTTRNKLAWEKYPGNPQFYADYVFVGPEIVVKKFLVPKNIVSDHQPLILEI